MVEDEKEKQVRMTREDTLRNQQVLSKMFKLLIDENRPMNIKEREQLREIMAKALLTQGAIDCTTMVIDGGWFTFSSLQSMILRVSEIDTDLVRLTTHKPEYNTQVGSIGELWKFIYGQLMYYFPLAVAEGFRASKESTYRVEQGAYDFDSREVV